MKVLIVATSTKPINYDAEIKSGRRYRLEYLELSKHLSATFLDYDPPGIHDNKMIRSFEESIRLDFYWAREIARIVEEQGYSVVISMSERIAVPLGQMLNNSIKHVAIFINPFSFKWRAILRMLRTHQKWEKIIFYSHAEAEAFRKEYQIESDKIHTILNYVDTNFFKPEVKNRLEQDGQYILSQGLTKRDYPTLIKAMRQLPHIDCYISATSAWDNHKAGYESLEIPDNIHIKSYDHPYDIRESISKCRFVVIPVQPNIGQWCTGSTSVLQTQAMGKPIVVTFLPGIAEYVLDGETGFLVKGNKPAAMADIINDLWQNQNKAETIGQRGHDWVSKKFSLENWVQNMTELIDSLV